MKSWKNLLVIALMTVPVVTFLGVYTREVPLVPLEGFDSRCARCDRPAVRTLKRVAKSMQKHNVYVYDKGDFGGVPPVWCGSHGPDRAKENVLAAYLSAIGVFSALTLLYVKLPDPD